MSIIRIEAVSNDLELTWDFDHTAEKVYHVYTDSAAENPESILASGSLPAIGDAYGSTGAVVVEKRIKNDDKMPTLFIVSVRYKRKIPNLGTVGGLGTGGGGGGGPEDAVANPLSRPVIWTGTSETTQDPVTVENNGDAIVNSAGDPFEVRFYVDKMKIKLVATKNVACSSITTSYLSYIQGIGGHKNVATWQGFAAGSLVFKEFSFDFAGETTNYYVCRYSFLYDPDDYHTVDVIQRGPRYIEGIPGVARRFPTGDGFLTNTGAKLTDFTNPAIGTFDYIPFGDFSSIII